MHLNGDMSDTAKTIQKRGAVRRLIFNAEGVTRRDIAKRLDMDVRTVSDRVDRLLAIGYIREAIDRPDGKGRPAKRYFPNLDRVYFIGLNIAKSQIQSGLFQRDGKEIEGTRRGVEIAAETKLTVINRILALIEEYKTARAGDGYLGGIGISCSRWLRPPLAQYDIFSDIERAIATRHDVPVRRDIPIDVLTYVYRDRYPWAKNLAVVHPGIVLEVGMTLNGEVSPDYARHESEFAHISVRDDGPECYCGQRGCVEHYVTNGALLERYGRGDAMNAFIEEAKQPGSAAARLADETGELMGKALAIWRKKRDLDLVVLMLGQPELFGPAAARAFAADPAKLFIAPRGDVDRVAAAAHMIAYENVERYIEQRNLPA